MVDLPPPRHIVPLSGHRIAATYDKDIDSLVVDVFIPGKKEQLFHVYPDGRIRLYDSPLWTGYGYYGAKIGFTNDADNAFKWTILETPESCTINNQVGSSWAFSYKDDPIPVEVDGDPERGLQKFHIIHPYPGAGVTTLNNLPRAIKSLDTKKLIITGPLVRPGAPIPARLEFGQFVKEKKFFSLYVQALIKVKNTPENELTSFYQLCGIHAFPLVEWNKAESKTGSYCQHVSVLFPTWHRPYVALFEQIIQERALEIAKEYTTDREGWVRAAMDLRQPYWDWAKPNGSVPPPQLTSRETLKVETPEGPRDVANPFIAYDFKSKDSVAAFPKEFTGLLRTARNRYSDDPVDEIKKGLEKAQNQLTMNTYNLFNIKTWEDFSNKSKSTKMTSSSLEAIHDEVHNLVGRFGHFSSGCAAFDPLFFIHHCQLDRLLSLWTTLNNGTWVPEPKAREGLSPFWKSEHEYWNSYDTRDHTAFRHTYPEYLGVSPSNLKRHIQEEVDKLYGGPDRKLLQNLENKSSMDSWSLRIDLLPFAVDQSFSMFVFIDQEPEEPSQWLSSPNLVGSYNVFITYRPAECENCQSYEGERIEGFVHLTASIAERLRGFKNSQEVAAYLKNYLYLGLQKVDGTLVDLQPLQFKAEVVRRTISKAGTGAPNQLEVGDAVPYPFDIKLCRLFKEKDQ